jgi:integrase/recombinase XerD
MARITKTRKPQPLPETPLESLMLEHLRALAVKNYSGAHGAQSPVHIGFFLQWCKERGLTDPVEVTRPVLERYQRHLFHYRKKNGEPLSFRSQHSFWFRCACGSGG